MSNVREIVRKHVEEETLKSYLKQDYATTTTAKKRKIIKFANEMIENKVQTILDTFIRDINHNSPNNKRIKNFKIFSALVTIIGTSGVAHAINLENWFYFGISAAIVLIMQLFPIFKEL